MFRLCADARTSIDIEQYIFSSDNIGARYVELLREKARAGVKVRILCDAVGSWDLYNSPLPEHMRADGIDIRFVNMVGPWRVKNISSWFFRDHRKLLIVDNKTGLTGSSGLHDDMTNWRETNVEVSTDGINAGIVTEMVSSFNEMWERTGDKRMISRISRSRKYIRGFQFIINAPYFRKRFLYYTVIDALRSAKNNIYLTTPYFIPDRRLLRALQAAVKRGVVVKLMLPKANFEVELFVGSAVRSYYERLLRAGIKIYEYNKSFLHAKTITIDNEWATVGSFNLDNLSFMYNYEANVVSTDPYVVQPLTAHFNVDLMHTNEIFLADWQKRPFIQKLQEFLVIPIRRFM